MNQAMMPKMDTVKACHGYRRVRILHIKLEY